MRYENQMRRAKARIDTEFVRSQSGSLTESSDRQDKFDCAGSGETEEECVRVK
jgi:hypothetical protein